jgi:two-component system, NarL family, response regulator DesR
MAIRVAVGGDQPLFLEVLARTLDTAEGLDVVAVAHDHETVLPTVERTRPSVLLLGETTLGAEPLGLASEVRTKQPACGIALMVGTVTPAVVDRAVAAGALGIVPKTARFAQLVTTVRGVAGGCLTVHPALFQSMKAAPSSLSIREVDVLRLTVGGATVKEIAAELYLASGTVRNLTSSAMKKLGGRNRFDAARIAGEQGWL